MKLGALAGMRPRWLQPVVFNAALFDFHPETWVMPAFALAIWACAPTPALVWLLLLMLGCRDGLLLIIAGMAIDLLAGSGGGGPTAVSLSGGWLLMLSRWLYPLLRNGEGPGCIADVCLNNGPIRFCGLDWDGCAEYLLPRPSCIVLWRRDSISTLPIGLPLVLVNLLSIRELPHPGASLQPASGVVAVVGCIDGHGAAPQREFRGCAGQWSAGLRWPNPGSLRDLTYPGCPSCKLLVRQALIHPQDAVLTTSYLVPQFSQRISVSFPKTEQDIAAWNVLLLNPGPGLGFKPRIRKDCLLKRRQEAGHAAGGFRDWSFVEIQQLQNMSSINDEL